MVLMLVFLAAAKPPEPAKDEKDEEDLASEFSSIELFHAGDEQEFEEEQLIGSGLYLECSGWGCNGRAGVPSLLLLSLGGVCITY